MKGPRFLLLALIITLAGGACGQSQSTSAPGERSAPTTHSPSSSPPPAGGPVDLRRSDIAAAMRRVADWQLKAAEGHYDIDWTNAVLYDGLLAASKTTADARYRDKVRQVAIDNDWELGPRFSHADDEAIGLAYLELYGDGRRPDELAPTLESMNELLARPDDSGKNLWWWCDALFMAPPVLAQLSLTSGDERYLDFMDREWRLTSASLYDADEHLYYRDDQFLARREANGQKVFWSRGNGWALAGLALVLGRMPDAYPARAEYVAQFQEMAGRIAALQPTDGVWRASLLDPASYPDPETSGTALFTYALAWGINAGLLDRQAYLPVVVRAWNGMLAHVTADGKLGSVQPIGDQPARFDASATGVYGTGAFLLAGSELYRAAGE